MKIEFSSVFVSAFSLFALSIASQAQLVDPPIRPVVGSTVSAIVSTDTGAIVVGWSATRGLLNRAVFNESGQYIGSVMDIIVTRDTNLTYLIIGASGFVGTGRHDVAALISDIREEGPRLVWPGATRAHVKSMPHIVYARNTALRDAYIAEVEEEIKRARELMIETQKNASLASGDAKAKLDKQVTDLRKTLKTTEEKIEAVKQATAERWREFKHETDSALKRLRQIISWASG
jgi:hypothetical protein